MKVIQTIQSTNLLGSTPPNEPVEVIYYSGDCLSDAMSAVVMAMADVAKPDRHYSILSVHFEL